MNADHCDPARRPYGDREVWGEGGCEQLEMRSELSSSKNEINVSLIILSPKVVDVSTDCGAVAFCFVTARGEVSPPARAHYNVPGER